MAIEVKVCGITRKEDAETALTAGAKYLGFIQYPKSPRKISLDSSKSIMQSVDSFSFGKVAVDVCPTPESVVQMKDAGFDFFQFHFAYDFDIKQIRQWSELVGPSSLWLAPKIPPGTSFPESLLDFADTFVIDAYSKDKFGGTGNTSDWGSFLSFQKDYPTKKWVLAGGIGPQNVAQAIQVTNPAIIDLNSMVEIEPGIKEKEKIKTVFKFLSDL
ncbi:MAG: phosphoribosylanthranilate isomerase [Verrucomicrobiota bacterium]|nr:phosphoribosylanthranilate isomerase [Verrucomicrobiota bacterium]